MNRATLPLAALLLLAAPPVRAVRPLTVPAPEFPDGDAWLNSKPMTLKSLRQKRAALIFFFSVDNTNSRRALEVARAWESRYGPHGLTVIGVHVPELDYHKDLPAVSAALKRLGVSFPVALDADRAITKAYANEGWPAFYLVDTRGRIVHDQLGERAYSDFEEEIRETLEQIPGVYAPTPAPVRDPGLSDCGAATADVSAGGERGKPLQLGIGETRLVFLTNANDGTLAYKGGWAPRAQSLDLVEENRRGESFVGVIYRGARAYAVFGLPKGTARVYVRQDDLWLHPGNAGADVSFDEDGRSLVDAKEFRLHELARNPTDDAHELTLVPTKAGSRVYGFSFADKCMAEYKP